ncbi:MAG: FKBP-type peptidyl-prolyl cis-trans isomerase [Pseudohongiella sp.]|uniref:FKBP-type peptidyl-prolyl cis-trans isomerase n=1 Tax=Pseudohongiella sp. TaxID=1979412 RepID=UPI0034A01059
MKSIRASGLGLAVSLAVLGGSVQAQDLDLTDERARIGYSVGVNIGQNLVMQGLTNDIDMDAFMAGLSDVVAGEPQLTEEEVVQALTSFQQQLIAREEAAQAAAQAESEAYLADNAQAEGVTVTDSGLQYLVLESGDAGGTSPQATDSVLAHYEGRFVNGDVFDSSIERGEPAQFVLNQVIPGWTEGLQMMKPGDKWRLFIPSDLAYGPGGSGPIPPHATLIFDVELLEVNPAQ